MIGLRDMMAQMSGQYANNADAMRRFALLSENIRNIMEILGNQGVRES